jgi:hypothetical protein
MNELIIFIGPKKTGTTSVYEYIKRSNYDVGLQLLPKESNVLIDKPLEYISDVYRNKIDISPEYYTSWRALLKAIILLDSGANIEIIVLDRPYDQRFNSHLNYMLGKLELSSALNEPEWESMFNSSIALWEKYWPGKMRVMKVSDVPTFLFERLGINPVEMFVENKGGTDFRSRVVGLIAKWVAKGIRKVTFGRHFIEFVSPIFRPLVYGRETKHAPELDARVKEAIKQLKK